MGAKTASKPRLRNMAFKCDICGRKFTKLDGLKSHQRINHDIQPQQLKLKQMESKAKNKPDIKKKIVKSSRPKSISSNNNQETVSTEKNEDVKHDIVEFECPKCFRIFHSYFPALKHIQKFHCVNKQGTKVSPNSPFLIKPIRIELCRKCNRKVKSIQTHVCDSVTSKRESEKYACTGCDSTFTSWRSFDIHVVSMHGDDLESLFFPSDVEFAKWKLDMENQTKAKYNLIDKYEYKCFYHCTFESAQPNNNVVTLCPSTIVVQELSKGIQVCLYKNHYKHTFVNYKLANKYKKYELDAMIKEPVTLTYINESKCDDNDIYVQFRTLMEKIVMDAAKVDINTLKILLAKAKDINTIITSYEDRMSDNEDSAHCKSMKENDILNELMDTKVVKRKAMQEQKIEPAKRPKVDVVEINETIPKIVNFYSLSNEKALKEVNQIHDVKVPTTEIQNNKSVLVIGTIPKLETTSNNTSSTPQPLEKKMPHNTLDKPFSTFDESYADFLSKNFVTKENQDFESKRTRSSTQNRRKPVVKTKMGQFKGVSPKKETSNTDSTPSLDTSVSPKTDILVKSENASLTHEKPTPTTLIKDEISPPQINVTNQPQKDVNNEINKDINKSSNKELNNSPKGSKVAKRIVNLPRKIVNLPKRIIPKAKPSMKPRFSSEKPKVDIVYEVKEQQDDCNILILKI